MANIVSSQPLDKLFTREITILVECVLFGSLVYLLICYIQSRYEIKKVYDSYELLKLNYKDILTEDDLIEIFDNDEILDEMKKTISKSEKIYLSIWIAFLIGAFVVVEIVSISPTYQSLFDIIQRILKLMQNVFVRKII